MATDTKLQELVINTMIKAQYDALETKDPNGIYAVTDAKIGARDLETSNVGTAGQVLSKTDSGMEWKDVQGGGSSTDNNGLEGDYCSRYGIVDETQSGLPTKGTGNQVIIPAQLVMDIPGVQGLTTNSSVITHDLTSTTNCELFLANGNIIEATDVFFQQEEPEDGTTGFAAWWNGTEWKFKSNDTGNVFRPANAVRIAKCIFTDGNLTRLCFTGCRLLNKQEWLPLSGGTLSGALIAETNVTNNISMSPVLKFVAKKTDGTIGTPFIISVNYNGQISIDKRVVFNGDAVVAGSQTTLGTSVAKVKKCYLEALNNGGNISVPNTSGTMVVATPPTEEGTYTLKATVAADGTVTNTWVKDA